MAADLRAVGGDLDFCRPWRRPRRLVLGLDGRQNRPTQGVHSHRAQCCSRHRHHVFHSWPGRLGRRVDFPVILPFLCRLWQCRADSRRYPAGAGICPVLQAWLGQRADDHTAAGGQRSGRAVGGIPGADHRLAWSVPRRPDPGAAGADDPLLGTEIAALVDAHGAAGGGAQVFGLGAADGPERNRAADPPPRGREDVVARAISLSAQRSVLLPRRAEPDRRRRDLDVDHDTYL